MFSVTMYIETLLCNRHPCSILMWCLLQRTLSQPKTLIFWALLKTSSPSLDHSFLKMSSRTLARTHHSLSIIWNSSSHLPAKTTVTAGTNRPREVFIFRTVIVFKYFFVIITSVIQPPKKQTKDWAMNGSAEISPFDFMSNLEFENL